MDKKIKQRGLSKARREEIEAYLFLSPWIICFICFLVFPLAASIYLSLTEYNILTPSKFIGLSNFRELFFIDELFWHSLKVTAIYTAIGVPLQIILGYSFALLLNQKIRALAYFRTIYYLPAVTSGVAVAMLWLWFFNPEMGIANALLDFIGIKGPEWFASTKWALPTFIIISLWGVGGGIVIYLAGLQSIPTQLYEAAELDGSTRWDKLRHITIPLTTPVIFFQLIIGLIGSLQIFTTAYVITSGGPGNATLFYVLYLYRNGWQYFRMGYASALAWILFIIILMLTLTMFKFANRWVYYGGAPRR